MVSKAIQSVGESQLAFCKFLSPNDTGETNSHQYGIHISMEAIPILFDTPSVRGHNRERSVVIKWQDDFETTSRFKYYGERTRNEHRITRFGQGFPFLHPEHTGDLFVLCKHSDDFYEGFVFSTEEEIDTFLGSYGMSPTDVGKLITNVPTLDLNIAQSIDQFIEGLTDEFPSSNIMSEATRRILESFQSNPMIDPDELIVAYTQLEYKIFQRLEQVRYSSFLNRGFSSVDEFVEAANTVLNRRKSRAGRSLEKHLSAIFTSHKLEFEEQVKTEGNKRPDFIFPDAASYHDFSFPASNLVSLASKTTCKDRWRQILNEANRIDTKHLFTLQQSISSQQIAEMVEEHVTLIVPSAHIKTFAPLVRDKIWTLSNFISFIKEKQGIV